MLCTINLVISLALLPFTRPLGATEGICSSSRNVELAISSRKPTAQEAAGSPAWLPWRPWWGHPTIPAPTVCPQGFCHGLSTSQAIQSWTCDSWDLSWDPGQELGLLSLKDEVWGGFRAVCHGKAQRSGAWLLSEICCGRRRGNRRKVEREKFWLHAGKASSSSGSSKIEMLPREVVKSPSLELAKP